MTKLYSNLLQNVHEGLLAPSSNGTTVTAKGSYVYFHYGCDDVSDMGWGCGYRTLQTISSWICLALNKEIEEIPSISEIQKILFNIDDKPSNFVGSREWIGTFEACLVLDHVYGVSSKIIHITKGNCLKQYTEKIKEHFIDNGSPIMMGGNQDCSSKGILGIHTNSEQTYLLIVDPHFIGKANNSITLHNKGYVRWYSLDDFIDSSFYNLCLPQVKMD